MYQVFKCEYCTTSLLLADEMRKHEDECTNNPKNRKCGSCKHKISSYDYYKEIITFICDKDVPTYIMNECVNDSPCPIWEDKY